MTSASIKSAALAHSVVNTYRRTSEDNLMKKFHFKRFGEPRHLSQQNGLLFFGMV